MVALLITFFIWSGIGVLVSLYKGPPTEYTAPSHYRHILLWPWAMLGCKKIKGKYVHQCWWTE